MLSSLEPLRADHAPAVLAFEVANREYFAASIADRGDDFFDRFPLHFAELLDEQDAGRCACYVLVDEDGAVLGRFNLYYLDSATADLGYRVAEHAAGQGVATATVRELTRLAADRHGLRTLRAGTSERNIASQKVLLKAGFVFVGPAEVGGKAGRRFELDLEH
ncbi:GNAT family N-acetyltransferase [Dactylosporangium sp. NPDC051541]|uniref:GNAT family N-acetyltransferase n=1 Tax=Dactylosporangium sp. NPDC051541 TaxID=3363977 RepID=UPI0037B6AEEC